MLRTAVHRGQSGFSLGTEKKKVKFKEQLAYKRASPRSLPNGRGAAGTLSGSERLESNMVYILPPP